MQEIKFRAWLKKEKKMVNVDYIDFANKAVGFSIPYTVVESGDEYIEVDMEYHYFEDVEIMQSTGLKDKNGKEIYEGDIVETIGHNSSKTLEIVKYSEGCFNVGDHCGSSTKRSPMLLHSKKIKVAGNIYENADLL